MALVEMSPVLASGLPARILDATSKGSSSLTNTFAGQHTVLMPLIPYNYSLTYNGTVYAIIHIMQTGTGIPSDLSSLSSVTARASDQLISFGSTGNTDNTFVNTCNVSTNPAIINTLYKSATASGTATWFRWIVYNNSNTIMHQAIGSVGTLGSGADLEMSSTTVVSGQLYKIINFRIQFATSWVI